MLTVGLMIVSFAAGMLTQRIVFREPQTDAGLTYIEDIPVMTDFLPEGTRARPGQKREIKLSCHPRDRQHRLRRKCGCAQLVHPPERQRRGGALFRGTTRWTITRSTTICRMMRLPYHAGDGMEKNGGNMNGIGIEMCVNSDGNYEQTLINTEKLCARLLIEYDLNPSKALEKHQDFRAKSARPPSSTAAAGMNSAAR